ncbi:Hypothetical predicted protein [Lecanosticta acicola]|uniref:Uncharacterized protein n=1 Tax=Lecanosticta acicola TaxID=111012 RepID=A0AAI8Z670_9PEZI|nr:Hypothetical predicted protein [Lecanosticta acicola]
MALRTPFLDIDEARSQFERGKPSVDGALQFLKNNVKTWQHSTFAIDARVKWLEQNRPTTLATFKSCFEDRDALDAAMASAERQRHEYESRVASVGSKWPDWNWTLPHNRTPPSWSIGLLKKMVTLSSITDRHEDALEVVAAEVTRRLRRRSVGSVKVRWAMASDVVRAIKIVKSWRARSESIEQGRGGPSAAAGAAGQDDAPSSSYTASLAPRDNEEPQGFGSFSPQGSDSLQLFPLPPAQPQPQGSASLHTSALLQPLPQGSASLRSSTALPVQPQGSASLRSSTTLPIQPQGSASLFSTRFFPPQGSATSLLNALSSAEQPSTLQGLLPPGLPLSSPPGHQPAPVARPLRAQERVNYTGLAGPSRDSRRRRSPHQADPPTAFDAEPAPAPVPEPTAASASTTSHALDGLLAGIEEREMLERVALLGAPPAEHALREEEYLATLAFRREMEDFIRARAPRHYWNQ